MEPARGSFTHDAPATTSEHVQFFRAPVIFACLTNPVRDESEFCKQPIPAADSNLFKILSRYLERVLRHVPKEDRRLESVRRKITEALKDGSPKLAYVAKAMALSPRTL